MRGTRTSGTDCIETTSANGRITHDDVKSQSGRSRGAGVIVNAEVAVLNYKHAKTNEDFGFLHNKEVRICTLPPKPHETNETVET